MRSDGPQPRAGKGEVCKSRAVANTTILVPTTADSSTTLFLFTHSAPPIPPRTHSRNHDRSLRRRWFTSHTSRLIIPVAKSRAKELCLRVWGAPAFMLRIMLMSLSTMMSTRQPRVLRSLGVGAGAVLAISTGVHVCSSKKPAGPRRSQRSRSPRRYAWKDCYGAAFLADKPLLWWKRAGEMDGSNVGLSGDDKGVL